MKGKYYLSLRSVEILPTKICVPNPVFTFAPATKMTTDAVWNGGMGTLAIHLERRKGKGGKYVGWRNAPRKKWKGRRNGQGKLCFPAAVTECPWPSLSCGHGLRSRVILRRHLSPNGLACHCPVWQRQGKAVWEQETRNRREWSQVQIHARRVLHPAAFPAANKNEKRKNGKTVLTVQHKP